MPIVGGGEAPGETPTKPGGESATYVGALQRDVRQRPCPFGTGRGAVQIRRPVGRGEGPGRSGVVQDVGAVGRRLLVFGSIRRIRIEVMMTKTTPSTTPAMMSFR